MCLLTTCEWKQIAAMCWPHTPMGILPSVFVFTQPFRFPVHTAQCHFQAELWTVRTERKFTDNMKLYRGLSTPTQKKQCYSNIIVMFMITIILIFQQVEPAVWTCLRDWLYYKATHDGCCGAQKMFFPVGTGLLSMVFALSTYFISLLVLWEGIELLSTVMG